MFQLIKLLRETRAIQLVKGLLALVAVYLAAVSYTHLDVYKRQDPKCTASRCKLRVRVVCAPMRENIRAKAHHTAIYPCTDAKNMI